MVDPRVHPYDIQAIDDTFGGAPGRERHAFYQLVNMEVREFHGYGLMNGRELSIVFMGL